MKNEETVALAAPSQIGMPTAAAFVRQSGMKNLLLATLILLGLASSAGATEAAVVAVVNGDTITADRLDELWESLSDPMKKQYEQVGGKTKLLDTYLRKRLLLQDAARNGFEGAADARSLDLKAESDLFNRYVRSHFGARVVKDSDVDAFYVANTDRFRHLDQAYVRQIFVSTKDRSLESAREHLGQIMTMLHQKKAKLDTAAFVDEFARTAATHSEDANRGDLGWRERLRLAPPVADAAFTMKPGTMSGILTTDEGVHLVLVEQRRPAGVETLENARNTIFNWLVSQRAKEVVKAADQRTDELMSAGKVTLRPENIR
jgi:peptidyl-prolyl cis-trans isomerase C